MTLIGLAGVAETGFSIETVVIWSITARDCMKGDAAVDYRRWT